MAQRKRKPKIDPVTPYELEKLKGLEDTDRAIKAEEEELKQIRGEFRERIKELRDLRDTLLRDLERSRTDEPPLSFGEDEDAGGTGEAA